MPYLQKAHKIRNEQINRPNRQKVYQTAKWRKLRLSKLQLYPLCELCLKKDIVKPAVDVHHIISPFSVQQNYKDFYAYNFNNLMSLCKECHGKIHSEHKEKDYYYIYYERENEE